MGEIRLTKRTDAQMAEYLSEQMFKQSAELTTLRADLAAAQKRIAELDKELDHMDMLVGVQGHVIRLQNQQLAACREGLEKLESYNRAIQEGQINYRPMDHIQVARTTLARVDAMAAGEGGEEGKNDATVV